MGKFGPATETVMVPQVKKVCPECGSVLRQNSIWSSRLYFGGGVTISFDQLHSATLYLCKEQKKCGYRWFEYS